MATPIESHPRTSLHPLWTPSYNQGGFPRSSTSGRQAAPSSYYSPSDRSPKSLPTPVFPSNDGSMRQHERAMVDRLGSRLRQAPGSGDLSPPKSANRPSPLSPLAEHSASDGRRYSAAPISPRRPGPPPSATPLSPPMASPRMVSSVRRQTLAAETRSMLLAGLGEEAQRRQSVAGPGYVARSREAEKRIQLEQLRAWGHVYLGDAKTSDVFVQAVSLNRRSSNASTNSDQSAGGSSPPRMPSTPTLPPHQRMMKFRVRPRALERKPMLITHTFDIEQLRSTIADPLPSPAPADQRRRPSLHTQATSPLPKASSPRPSAARRRSSSAIHSTLPYSRGLKSGDPRAASSRGADTIPIHLQYARSSLPVLAAIIVSGTIQAGDVVELPLPYPEVWSQTVTYVYTGQGDLTDAVKENILYLAGKV
ncbi:hypothetical protein BDP55DRAFT_544441 [Colletotrichum godetiae]|uniref:Uncharacterized protein n=1 Tax=Colletotrichum godetiae TaxID=1209918 RepID=A0AAJ0AU97_9PEZI|nr:uncharacterized protein BDP55DRAFT_544441 [Colletotrichum godetiae]KAK1690483.1 hypothetical protein BDP55DRAFT_544441 [Colletotrichum godetiae]